MPSIFSTKQQTDSRTEIITRAKAKLKKRQHTLLVGCFGAGKSWLLDSICAELSTTPVIRLSLTIPRKAFVIAIVERMHADGHNLDFDPDWEKADKAIRKLTVKKLVERIQPYINQYTFIVDDLERATERTAADVVFPLLDGLVLAAADVSSQTQARRIAPIINHFHRIEVPPLTKDETSAMLWSLVERSNHKRHRLLETQNWNMSRGVPGVVADIADQLGESGSIKDVRQLQHDAPGVRYVGLLPAVLVLGIVILVLMRYTARGFSDPYIYVFTASGYTVLRMMMYPLQRWADG